MMRMREADAVEIVERTPLEGLGELSPDVVYTQVEYLARELPGPVDLYQRWERQQWSATAIDFAVDRRQWDSLGSEVRLQIEGGLAGFFNGEQAVTDTLSPLVHAAPTEEDRLFLSTQLVDEARHSYFFTRFFRDVLGVGGTIHDALDHAIGLIGQRGGYGGLLGPDGELLTLTDAVRVDPGDYGKWVQAITLYHLLIEGMVGLSGQRRLLRLFRSSGLLPGFRTGFTAATRDESRHVSYGVWALRQAVRAGREPDVRTVVDRALVQCVGIGADPRFKLPRPSDVPPPMRLDPREQWAFTIDSLTKRLRGAGVDPDYIADVDRRAWELTWDVVARYEEHHGEEHPVRAWERGEVTQTARAS